MRSRIHAKHKRIFLNIEYPQSNNMSFHEIRDHYEEFMSNEILLKAQTISLAFKLFKAHILKVAKSIQPI